jgi:hypothetical protein
MANRKKRGEVKSPFAQLARLEREASRERSEAGLVDVDDAPYIDLGEWQTAGFWHGARR